ncbi:hypothetical protein [Roseibium sp.]|uniref:hypothetical protein n=1 Tax=Roseibium sp. TaxID=1936156 RepID=UPI003BB09538
MVNRFLGSIVAAVSTVCICIALLMPVSTVNAQANEEGLVGPFDAVYFDRTVDNPHKIRETVPSIAIQFDGHDGFQGIKANRFAASWSGFVSFDRPVTKLVQVSQGHAKTRIKINGTVVYEGGSNAEFEHAFAPGEHLVEVFHINNWHTVEFKVTIQDKIRLFSANELASQFTALQQRPRDLVYFGLYGSRSKDLSVNIDLSEHLEGAVVWLDSYEAIDWTFRRDPGIRAVVIAAYTPGSRVIGLDGNVPVFHTRDTLDVRSKPKTRCTCSGAVFHCENQGRWAALEERLYERTGAQITAIAAESSAESLRPEAFDQALRKAIAVDAEKVKQAEAACKKRRNPDFDTLFENQ